MPEPLTPFQLPSIDQIDARLAEIERERDALKAMRRSLVKNTKAGGTTLPDLLGSGPETT
jgi:hypothetical protein